MVFGFSVARGGWKRLVVPVLYVFGILAAAIADRVVEDTATDARVSLSVAGLAEAVLNNWLLLGGWAAFLSVAVAAIITYVEDRKFRPSRVLEHHGMFLVLARKVALTQDAEDADLDKIMQQVRDQRGALLNMTGSVFTHATAEAFRPGMTHLGDAQKQVDGFTHYDKRVSALADVEKLLDAVQSKWVAYGGHEAPTP